MTLALAIYGAVAATAGIGWQVYSHTVRMKADRRERASGVVGSVHAFLWHINPENGLIGAIPEDRVQEAITDYSIKWDAVRDKLETLRIAHTSAAVATLAAATTTAIEDSLGSSFWAMRRERPRALSDEEWATLKEKFAAAETAAHALERAVREG